MNSLKWPQAVEWVGREEVAARRRLARELGIWAGSYSVSLPHLLLRAVHHHRVSGDKHQAKLTPANKAKMKFS